MYLAPNKGPWREDFSRFYLLINDMRLYNGEVADNEGRFHQRVLFKDENAPFSLVTYVYVFAGLGAGYVVGLLVWTVEMIGKRS